VIDIVLHPYKTMGKIIVMYIFITAFLDLGEEDKYPELLGRKNSPYLTCL
jgi:hypothetical protein